MVLVLPETPIPNSPPARVEKYGFLNSCVFLLILPFCFGFKNLFFPVFPDCIIILLPVFHMIL